MMGFPTTGLGSNSDFLMMMVFPTYFTMIWKTRTSYGLFHYFGFVSNAKFGQEIVMRLRLFSDTGGTGTHQVK